MTQSIITLYSFKCKDDKVEKVWEEAVMAYSRHYPGICQEELRKSMKNTTKIASILAQI
jgi:hypothetical protein